MDFKSSIQLFKSTKFRLVKNGLRVNRGRGTVQDVSKMMKQRGFNPLEETKKSEDDTPSLEDMGKSASAAVGMTPKLGLDIDVAKLKR